MFRHQSQGLIALATLVTCAQAGSLDDFSNNLATDLGPLVQLFGEPVTTQYLSEATTFIDYFIFAMAPIGILTAIISVIRVCGDSSLRAFIGRAQEGDGNVEAELCTSTSRDVCELFNKGGITRVLGRPKILEIIHVPKEPQEHLTDRTLNGDDMGLFHFRDHLDSVSRSTNSASSEWEEDKSSTECLGMANIRRRLRRLHTRPDVEGQPARAKSSTRHDSGSSPFAPNPNLSLNVGIIKLPTGLFYAVAALGFILQAGIIVMAAVVSWDYGWNRNDNSESTKTKTTTPISTLIATNRAPLTFIGGTFFMCLGMFLCAALIGQSTHEYEYKRKLAQGQRSPHTRLFWLQPGEQLIGDQTFDAFAYNEIQGKYLDRYLSSQMDLGKRSGFYTWITILLTVGGYVAQFIGLRGMNAYISIAQLGSTLLMSFLRGCLRIQRLTRNDNKFANFPDKILKHELDWLAFEIKAQNTTKLSDTFEPNDWFWYPSRESTNSEAAFGVSPTELLRYRSRLAILTGHPDRSLSSSIKPSRRWENHQVKVRSLALRLRNAIEGAINTLIGDQIRASDDPISFSIPITMRNIKNSTFSKQNLKLEFRKNSQQSVSDSAPWVVDSSVLEAILGLWVWSMIKGKHLETIDDYRKIVSVAEKFHNYRIVGLEHESPSEELEMWLMEDSRLSSRNMRNMKLKLPNSDGLDTMSLWHIENDEGGEILIPWDVTSDPKKLSNGLNPVRLFGWTAFSLHCPNSYISKTIPILCALTGASILEQCGQEIFTGIFGNLYGTLNPDLGNVSIVDVDGKIRWQNDVVSSLVARFEKAGLGTSSDALSCLLPTLRKELDPPEGELMILPLLKLIAEYRAGDRWTKAEIVLQQSCSEFRQQQKSKESSGASQGKALDNLKSVLLVIGELYRWAIASTDKQRRLFGYRGIQWMVESLSSTTATPSSNPASNQAVDQILGRYQEVGTRVAGELKENSFAYPVNKYEETNQEFLAWYPRPWPTRKIDKQQEEHWVTSRCRQSLPPSENDSSHNSDFEHESRHENPSSQGEGTSPGDNENLAAQGPKSPTEHKRRPGGGTGGTGGTNRENVVTGETQSSMDEPDEAAKYLLKFPVAGGESDEHRARLLFLLCLPSFGYEAVSRTSTVARAARSGWIEVVAALIEGKTYVNTVDKTQRTALHYACDHRHPLIVELLLESGAEPNLQDHRGRTPLLLATMTNAEDIVAMLLSTGNAAWKIPDEEGSTPLIVAAQNRYTQIVEILANHGALAGANAKDKYGRTALWYAVKQGSLEIVKILLSDIRNRTTILAQESLHKICAITVAEWNGNQEIFKLLYQHARKADLQPNTALTYPNGTSHSILATVIEKNFIDVFHVLLSEPELDLQMQQVRRNPESVSNLQFTEHNSGAQDRRGEAIHSTSALGLAIQYGREEMFDLLLKDDRLKLDELVEKPLPTAASYGRVSMVSKLLANSTIDPKIGDPLSHAASNGHEKAVETLLADPRVDPTRGEPLLKAVNYGNTRIVQMLLASMRCAVGQDELETAFQVKRFDIAWLLIQHIKEPNMPFYSYGNGSALHVAAQYNEVEFAKSLLLLEGIDLNLLNSKGQSPLSTAISAGAKIVIQLLVSDRRTNLNDSRISGCTWSPSESAKAIATGTVLHFAITLGDRRVQDALQILLAESRLDPNLPDQENRTPLAFILEKDQPDNQVYDALRLLLTEPYRRVNVNQVAASGRTPLHLAAESSHGLEQLLDHDTTDPNVQDAAGQTPLHLATLRETAMSVKLLLANKRTDPDIRDLQGHTAFDVLKMNGNYAVALSFLTNRRFEPWLNQGGTTALHVAAKSGAHDLQGFLGMLLDSSRIDPNQRDIEGNTALWVAVDRGHEEAVQTLLLCSSVEPNLPHQELSTVLHLLAKSRYSGLKYQKILSSLFENPRLDLNIQNSKGQTPLHVYLEHQTINETAEYTVQKFLKNSQMNPNVQDIFDQSILHLVAHLKMCPRPADDQVSMARIIKALVDDSRTDPNLKNIHKQTALHMLLSTQSESNTLIVLSTLVKSFLQMPRIDPNVADSTGKTALHLAAAAQPDTQNLRYALSIVRKLLRHPRVDPKRLDNKNQTALHYVTSAPVARLLLADARIDPNATNDMGNTILHQAVEHEFKEVVEVLLRDGRVSRHVRNGLGETALFMARRLGTGDNDIAFLFRNIGPPKIDMLEENQRLSALGEESSDEEGVFVMGQSEATRNLLAT